MIYSCVSIVLYCVIVVKYYLCVVCVCVCVCLYIGVTHTCSLTAAHVSHTSVVLARASGDED